MRTTVRWTRIAAPAGLAGAAVLYLHFASAPRRPTAHAPAAVAPAIPPPQPLPIDRPVRQEPFSFPPNTHIPPIKEVHVCGSIDLDSFDPQRDLVRVQDSRVWWESDERPGEEDDHLVHRRTEEPLLRLVELVRAAGGRLKVHDAYRARGPHRRNSLHKEGRAVDVTCDELSLEKLAKLCWAAGFDWVYYERTGRHGAHVHCSVRRD